MAIVQNLIIDQNSTFSAEVTVLTEEKYYFDLTNYEAFAHIKKYPTSANIAATFLCEIPTPTYGNIFLYLTDEQTALLKPGRYMYDVIIKNNLGELFRAIEGNVTVTPGITTLPPTP